MNFAFLVHPLGQQTSQLLRYDREGGLRKSLGWDLFRFLDALHVAATRSNGNGAASADRVRVIDELPGLISRAHAQTHGRLYEIPMGAMAILEDPDRALNYMLDAVNMAADWGARIVGLGSMTGIVGGQGTYLAERSPVPVTTGNSLTVFAAVENLIAACRAVELDLSEETVAIVGIPGSIATAAAKLLRGRCRSLLLVARRPSNRAATIASELDAELFTDIPTALARSRVVLSATSSGGCIEQRWLRPGSLVSDVGVPTDVLGNRSTRPDCLILSGGLCCAPETMSLDSAYLWLQQGAMPSCLGETIVLALEERAECFSLGRKLSGDDVARIGALALAHGFDFSSLYSFGVLLDDSSLIRYRKAIRAELGSSNGASRPLAARREASPPTAADLADRVAQRYRRYINPVLIALSDDGGLVKTFVRAQGMRLWDSEGKSYLDFVAGYGAVNLGHNHPAVVVAVETALAGEAPGFSPAALNPYAAALAEELVSVCPQGLEICFFSNSGAEAVEAALKLARRATGRRGLLHCERSFHGKTLGALSVTGNPDYQRPFEPLVPGAKAIPFGDLDALERALASREFAAFIVEPIQGEGGIVVPPSNYLPVAQALCRKTGTLLVVDEVQTGFGRTGTMFAVEQSGVEPDVMTLAKSLGGGVVPIGAMVARRELWKKAYGTVQSFALHTSTFGGGSLACAAGLAALKVLRDPKLLANVRQRGRQLREGLEELSLRSRFVRQGRGCGLLIGVEFSPLSDSMLTVLKGLLPGRASAYLVPGLEEMLESLVTVYVQRVLAEEHGIYTQVTRSNPRVLRVEPPLIIAEQEVSHFLQALEACCAEMEENDTVFQDVIAKSVRGHHNAASGERVVEVT
jgi:putrescine aminotransferase